MPTFAAPERVRRIGLVGLGTVGCGWAAAYLAKGYEVSASDTAPDVRARCEAFLTAAWPALKRLGIATEDGPPLARLAVSADLAQAVAGCEIVHENAPESLELKREIFAAVEAAAPGAVIGSSTGGLPPSPLQAKMKSPERLIVMHPFNPPHLVPLVEVIAGERTAPELVGWALEHLRGLGKQPIKIDKEAPGFLTNRLQFALLREAAHCFAEGIADVEAIEGAMRYGLAPRWAAIGPLTTLALSGGDGGMPAVMERFGGAIDTWWQALGAPTLTPEMRESLIEAGRRIERAHSMKEWAKVRDARLTEILERSGKAE